MNSDQMQGKWKQLKGAAREQWGKLTDDDLEQVQGKSEKLMGKVQEKYGVGKEEAKRQVDEFFAKNAEREANQ